MKRYKGMLRIYTGEDADKHPERCDFEEGEWIRADEVDAEIARLWETMKDCIGQLRIAMDAFTGQVYGITQQAIIKADNILCHELFGEVLYPDDEALAPEKEK